MVGALRHQIFRFGVEGWLNSKYAVEGGWDFSYERILFERDRITFLGVGLHSRAGDLALESEKVDLIARSFSGLKVDFALSFKNPLVSLDKTKNPHLFAIQGLLNGSSSSFKMDVEGGHCKLIEKGEITNLYFSLVSDETQRSFGSLYLSSEPQIKESSNLLIKLYRWPQECIAELEMKDIDFCWFTHVARFFAGHKEKEWKVGKGVVDGRLWIGLDPTGKLTQTTALVHVNEFSATLEEEGMTFSTEEISWDFSYPGGKKLTERVDVWWQNSTLKSRIQGGYVGFKDPSGPYQFSLYDISGDVNFSSFKDSEIHLKGFLDQNGEVIPILLSGNPSVVDKDTLDFDMKLLLQAESKYSTHLNLSLSLAEDDQCIVKGRLKDLGIEQMAMFQQVIGFAFPEVKEFHLKKGIINCGLSLLLNQGKVEKLLLDNLIADDLQVHWQTKDVLGFCSHLSGSAQLDFHTLPKFQFPAWEVNLENGALIIGREEEPPVGISDINMQIFMCRDVFEPSWIKGTYEGVEVVAGIVGYYPEADVKLEMGLSGDRALSFFSEEKVGLEDFAGHQVRFSVDLRRQLGYWDVNGEVDLDVKGDFVDHAKFGCHLSDRVMKNRGNSFLKNITASVSKGWFKGENVSCECMRFANHCVKNTWSLEGIVSIDGSFDSKEIDVDVRSQYLNFFSPFADLRLNASIDPSVIKMSEGKFHYNLKDQKFTGYFPIFNATFLEKELNLVLNETAASLYLDGNTLHFDDIKTESEGVELKGEVSVGFGSEKGIDLKIKVDNVLGTVWQVGNFIHHIPGLKEIELPFDGRVLGGEESLFLQLNTTNENVVLDWETHLRLMHANYHLSPSAVLYDLELDLDCSSEERLIRLSNIQGRLASNYYEDGYIFNGKNVEIYGEKEIERVVFDVRLENQVMDLIRLTGTFDGVSKEVHLDKEYTHIFGVFPEMKKFVLDEAYLPIALNLSYAFSLDDFFHHKRLLADLGIIDFSNFYEAEEGGSSISGSLQTALSLDSGLWKLELDGKGVSFEGKDVEKLHVTLEKEGDEYRIKECDVGLYQLTGTGKTEGDLVSLNNVTLLTAKSKVKFKPGRLSFQEQNIVLPIEKGSIDLHEYGLFSGLIDLQGDIGVNFGKKMAGKLFFAELFLEGNNLGKDQFKLTTPTKVNLEYSKERGVLLRDFSLLLKKGEESCFFEVPTLVYSTSEEFLQGFRIKASLSDKAIDRIEKSAIFKEVECSSLIPKNIGATTTLLFDFECTKDSIQIGGMLQEGIYRWRENTYDVHGLSFQYDKNHLDLYLQVPVFEREFGCNFKIIPHGNFETVVEAFEIVNEELLGSEKEVLYIECLLNTPEGLSIQKIEGNLFGLEFSFLPETKMEEEYLLTFLGSVKIDAEKLLPICNQDVKDFIQELKLKKGYALKGELTLLKGDLGNSFFEGYIQGKDFDLLGYQLKTFLSSIRFNKNHINISDFKISDEAVAVDIKEINVYLDEKDTWKVQIPELLINDLRPSLLKKRYQSNQRIKPFHIKNMVFQDVAGPLNNVGAFTGKGHLNFVNTFKQGHNLLDIPLEIISRLGLDMVLLVPIQGELEYVLKNGKVVFTKLKNSFSESKRSYFYLWNKTESYVDFEGNMHIDIRMKQYVLLKFTELFVLSINGSLESPRVSLK
jgi:hypothetical protein